MNNIFLRGKDMTVLINGKILGGVRSAEIIKQTTVYKIGEYLTDVPVFRKTRSFYIIKLKLESPLLFPLEGEIQTIEFEYGKECDVFENCALSGRSGEALPDSEILHTLTIEADKRGLEDE